jgi:hypothetical protein
MDNKQLQFDFPSTVKKIKLPLNDVCNGFYVCSIPSNEIKIDSEGRILEPNLEMWMTGEFDRCFPPNPYIGNFNEAIVYDSFEEAEIDAEEYGMNVVEFVK